MFSNYIEHLGHKKKQKNKTKQNKATTRKQRKK